MPVPVSWLAVGRWPGVLSRLRSSASQLKHLLHTVCCLITEGTGAVVVCFCFWRQRVWRCPRAWEGRGRALMGVDGR